MQRLFEAKYIGSTVTVSPYTLNCTTFKERRVVPLNRIARIKAASLLVAGVHVEGGPFAWGEVVPVWPDHKEALVAAVLKAQQDAPVMPTLYVQCIGGYGTNGITKGQEYLLFFDREEMVLQDGAISVSVPYSEITGFEIGGPGETKSNAGVIGGGFGVIGAIAGMALSAATNAATTRTRVDTLVTWRTPTSEVILHTSSSDPATLRIELSEQLAKIDKQTLASSAPSHGNIATQLKELADLHGSGVLSAEEFAAAKARVLS